MGGVPSVLLLLWCRGGCSTATVAAALTFFPPNPPCYSLRKKKDGSDDMELDVDELIEAASPTEGVQVATVSSGGGCSSSSCMVCNGAGAPGTGANVRSGRRARVEANQDADEKTARSSSNDMSGEGKGEKTRADALVKKRGKVCWKRKRNGSMIPLALYRREGARFTLVYSHGNATDIGAMHDRCSGIADAVGVNVLAYDYTGYGVATGSPTEVQTYRDIEAVCAWARQNVLAEGEDGSGSNKSHGLILYGQSVGSGPTCYLASEEGKGPFAGVVLHSPIMSGMRVLTDSRALSCLDIYPNVDRMARVRCPVMVMHGMKDEEVPWEHGKGIYEAVPEVFRHRPWWVHDRGHNDICEGRRHLREYYARLRAYVHSLEEDADADAGSGLIRVGRAFLGARPSRIPKPPPGLEHRPEFAVKGFGVHVIGSDSNGFILNGVHRMGHGEGPPGIEGGPESGAINGVGGRGPNPLQALQKEEAHQRRSGVAGESDGESDGDVGEDDEEEDEEGEEGGEEDEEEDEEEEDDDDDDDEDNGADESEMYRAIRAMTSMDGGLGERRQEYWAMGVGFCGDGVTQGIGGGGGGCQARPKDCRDGVDGLYPIPMDEKKSLSAVAASRSARTPRGPIWKDEEGVTWPMCEMSFGPSSVQAGASQ